MKTPRRPGLRPAILGALLAASLPSLVVTTAQEAPLVAGSEGVPVPRRTKMVKPEYPAEAQAKGIRGIVILDLTIDAQGKVTAVDVIRSIPGLDEAAIAAVKKWEYEPAKVAGKPVAVKLTVPITFLMQLPEITRQEGIPELRQGSVPSFPKSADASVGAQALAEVSIDSEGQVVQAEIRGGSPPFTDSLLQAVRTWAFAPDAARGILTFRVQATFVPSDKGSQPRVALALSGLQQTEAMGQPASPAPPAAQAAAPRIADSVPPSASAPVASAPSAPAAPPAAPSPSSPAPISPAPAAPRPSPDAPAAPRPEAVAPAQPKDAPAGPTAGPSAPPASGPKTEILRSPITSPPAAPDGGFSVVKDIVLEPNVPVLTRGRRPVPPPLARMARVVGSVQVAFAIDAAGGVTVQSSDGPDLLRKAAEDCVASWVFRRTSTDRLRAIAEVVYTDDKATASVKLAP